MTPRLLFITLGLLGCNRPPQVGELSSGLLAAGTFSDPGADVNYLINPSVVLRSNNQRDYSDTSDNPFGFTVFFRMATAASSVAAPTFTVTPMANGESVQCYHNGVIGDFQTGCAKPSVDQYCTCELVHGQADTTYQYTITLNGSAWVASVHTRVPVPTGPPGGATGSAANFKFAFYSDVHESNWEHLATIGAISTEGTDFGINGGDWGNTREVAGQHTNNAYSADYGLQIDAATGFRSAWPLFMGLGGHEWMLSGSLQSYYGWPAILKIQTATTYQSDAGYGTTSAFNAGIWSAALKKQGAQSRYYSFDWGNSHFVFLDTGMANDLRTGTTADCGLGGCWTGQTSAEASHSIEDRPQRDWLLADLKAANANKNIRHIFAVMHQLPYKGDGDDSHLIDDYIGVFDDSHGNAVARNFLHDVFSYYGVEAAFGGHAHQYYHVVKDGIHYITCGGGGEFNDYDHAYQGTENGHSDADKYYHFAGNAYCTGEVQGDTTTVKLRALTDKSGTPLDNWAPVTMDTVFTAMAHPSRAETSVDLNLPGTPGLRSVLVEWASRSSGNEDGFELWAKPEGGTWANYLPFPAGATAGAYTNAVPGHGTHFKVRAFKSGAPTVYSDYGNERYFVFPYDKMSTLSVTGELSHVHLDWPGGYSGNGPGLGFAPYEVYRKKASDAAYTRIKNNISSTSYDDWTVSCADSYMYKVRAVMNDGKFSDYSNEVTTTAGSTCVAVQTIGVASKNIPGNIDIKWLNDASNMDHLVVEHSTDQANWSPVLSAAPGTTTATVSGTPGGNYFRVGYVDNNGNISYGSETAVSLPGQSTAPTALAATPTVNQVAISGNYSSGGLLPDRISLYRSLPGQDRWTEIESSVPDASGVIAAPSDAHGPCGTPFDYALTSWFGGYQTAFSAPIRAQALCPTSACAGAVADAVNPNMQGCPGAVTWDNRNSLCADGFSACTADEWVENRQGQAPHHNYWTDDNLHYSGSAAACSAVTTGGNLCSSTDNRPMRICAGGRDSEGNTCTWTGCGFGGVTPNQYFGGCSANQTAGTMCCRNGTKGSARPAVAVGVYHSCAILSTGKVKCWGNDAYGQTGLANGSSTDNRGDAAGEMSDNLPSVNLGTGRTAKDVSAAYLHNCAVLDNGAVKCWGYNYNGQLGLGDTRNRGLDVGSMGDSLPVVSLGSGRTALSVRAGYYHSCAILDNGQLKCWGNNSSGQLGDGDVIMRGSAGGQMGDSLPAVSLGTGRSARAVALGGSHTCALLDDGSVKCWGLNSDGQLGYGDTRNRGTNINQMGDGLPAVSLGSGRTALAVTAGFAHTCALLDNFQMKCWGYGAYGQLGYGSASDRGNLASQMGDALAFDNLGLGRSAVAITAGAYHTCALLDNKTSKCWGYNALGQLGVGDTNNRGDGEAEMGDSLPIADVGNAFNIHFIAAGYYGECAILENQSIKCWGYNAQGQLGLGDVSSRGDAPGEMGIALPALDVGVHSTTLR